MEMEKKHRTTTTTAATTSKKRRTAQLKVIMHMQFCVARTKHNILHHVWIFAIIRWSCIAASVCVCVCVTRNAIHFIAMRRERMLLLCECIRKCKSVSQKEVCKFNTRKLQCNYFFAHVIWFLRASNIGKQNFMLFDGKHCKHKLYLVSFQWLKCHYSNG